MVREKEPVAIVRKKRPLFIRLVLPAGGAVSVAPLSATLGQAQINSSEFCKNFNALSSERFEDGVLLNTHVFKNETGYYFSVWGIFLPFLVFQVSDESKAVPVELIYDVYRLKQLSRGLAAHQDFASSKEFFGSLRSIGFRVIF
jgi:hypothetical protein